MSEFETYLRLGFGHISDLGAYDHIVFIVALCAVYKVSQWRRILILVTAFTLGHSITLALATLELIAVPTEIIEFLIPVTILLTALHNVFEKVDDRTKGYRRLNYLLALFFGLIHGMGFSNFLRALLGSEESILLPLLAFNVGLEIGQLLVVCCILAAAFVMIDLFNARHREWNIFVSGASAGISLIIMQQAWVW